MKNPVFTALLGSALLLCSCSSKNCDETNGKSVKGQNTYEQNHHSGDENSTRGDHANANANFYNTPAHTITGGATTPVNNDPTTVVKNGHVYHTDANIGKKNAIGNHSTVVHNRFSHRDLTHKSMDSLGNYNDIGPTYNNQNGH